MFLKMNSESFVSPELLFSDKFLPEADFYENDESCLCLRKADGDPLAHHNHGGKRAYIYGDPRTTSANDQRVFENMASDSGVTVRFGADRNAKHDAWKKFYEGLEEVSEGNYVACVVCRNCGLIIAHPHQKKSNRGSLTAMKQHLLRCNRSGPPTREDLESEILDTPAQNVFTKQNLENAVLAFVVSCNLSFLSMDSPFFKDLCDQIRLSTDNRPLPSRKVLADRLRVRAEDARVLLKAELKSNLSKVSISLDGWTSPNHLPFLGVVVHYIDNRFKPRQEVLAFDVLHGRHTAETLRDAVWDLLKEFGLLDKV